MNNDNIRYELLLGLTNILSIIVTVDNDNIKCVAMNTHNCIMCALMNIDRELYKKLDQLDYHEEYCYILDMI